MLVVSTVYFLLFLLTIFSTGFLAFKSLVCFMHDVCNK